MPLTGAMVLLVEDEESVRIATARMLSHAGYRVLVAATPREALDLFDEHASEIDLLLTDVVMPQMHGPELAQRMVVRRPDLPVLFVSGYSDTLPARTPTQWNVAFLPKPFPHAVLVTTVAGLLRARAV